MGFLFVSTDPTESTTLVKTVNLDIESDYPAQLQVGTRIHSGGGFLIGIVVAIGEEWEGRIGEGI